jgi:hypothetical protein
LANLVVRWRIVAERDDILVQQNRNYSIDNGPSPSISPALSTFCSKSSTHARNSYLVRTEGASPSAQSIWESSGSGAWRSLEVYTMGACGGIKMLQCPRLRRESKWLEGMREDSICSCGQGFVTVRRVIHTILIQQCDNHQLVTHLPVYREKIRNVSM